MININLKYSDEKIITDLKFIYEKYGSLGKKAINESHKLYNTVTETVVNDRVGNIEKRFNAINVECPNPKISFHDWCISNNRTECIELWDYEMNNKTPKDITYGVSKQFWFKCKECGHSRKYNINSITNRNMSINSCKYCRSIKKWCIDNNKLDVLERWDYEKNSCKPEDVLLWSKKRVYLKFPLGKHESQ